MMNAGLTSPPLPLHFSPNSSMLNPDEGLNGLSDDLLVEVLHYVPPIDLLRSVPLVSRRLATTVRDITVWRLHSSLPRLLTGNLTLNQHQLQRCCIFSAATIAPKYLELGSVLVPRECAKALRREKGDLSVCLASTTDHTMEQIDNVLPKNDTVEDWGLIRQPSPLFPPLPPSWRGSYWSSGESPTQETDEILLFTTRYPLALISEVGIKPFTDAVGQTYTWKKVVIKVYNLKVGADALLDPNSPGPAAGFPCTVSRMPRPDSVLHEEKAAPDQDTINSLLANQEPVYQSPVHDTPPPEIDSWQHFSLPAGVVGNLITMTLIGKNFCQFETSGFYICVERVAVRGIPLYTHPEQANEWQSLVEAHEEGEPNELPNLPLASQLLYTETIKTSYNTVGMLDDGRSVDALVDADMGMDDREEDRIPAPMIEAIFDFDFGEYPLVARMFDLENLRRDSNS